MLDRLERVSEAFHLHILEPQIAACRTILRDQGVVYIAVVGRFKAGKSSFLNSIAGQAVLPVGVLPATAVVTILSYGPTAQVRLRYVDVVNVELPSLAAYRGIRFVDTPGLGRGDHESRARETLGRRYMASPQGEEFLTELATRAEAGFLRLAGAFQNRLSENVERALRISFAGARFEATLPEVSHPDVRVDRAFDVPLDLIWFLVPMPLFRRLICRRLRGQPAWEMEKNLARLAVDWGEAMAGMVADMAEQARSFIEQELGTLEGLTTHPVEERPRVEEALRELELIERILPSGHGDQGATP